MIDCHMHLDETMVSLDGLAASMDEFGIERVALMARLNPPIYQVPKLLELAAPLLRKTLHADGGLLHKAVLRLYQSWVKPSGKVEVAGQRYEIIPQPPNDEVAAAVSKMPERFSGWIFVNPAGPADPLDEIGKYIQQPGMIGVKAHPYWHNYPVSDLKDTAALCAEAGMPMLIHLGAKETGDYRLLPEMFPSLRVIYAHCGVPHCAVVCALAREHDKVFVDLSSAAYVDLAAARLAIKRAGPDKCLFGSDGPYFFAQDDRFDFEESIAMIDALGLSQQEKAMVSRDNFQRILGGA